MGKAAPGSQKNDPARCLSYSAITRKQAIGDSEPTDIYFRGLLRWRSWYYVGSAFVFLALAVSAIVLLVANARLLWADYNVGRVIVVVALGGVAAGLSSALGLILLRIAVGHIDHQEISAKGFRARFGLWSGFIPWNRVRDVRIARRYFTQRYDLLVYWLTPRGFTVTGVFHTETGMTREEAEALMAVVKTRLNSPSDSPQP